MNETVIFEGLAQFAEKIVNAVCEDLGDLPEDLGAVILEDDTTTPTENVLEGLPGYMIYVVDLPDRNIQLFLWDYLNDGNIEVYSTWTLAEGYCLGACVGCDELKARGLTVKANAQ